MQKRIDHCLISYTDNFGFRLRIGMHFTPLMIYVFVLFLRYVFFFQWVRWRHVLNLSDAIIYIVRLNVIDLKRFFFSSLTWLKRILFISWDTRIELLKYWSDARLFGCLELLGCATDTNMKHSEQIFGDPKEHWRRNLRHIPFL